MGKLTSIDTFPSTSTYPLISFTPTNTLLLATIMVAKSSCKSIVNISNGISAVFKNAQEMKITKQQTTKVQNSNFNASHILYPIVLSSSVS